MCVCENAERIRGCFWQMDKEGSDKVNFSLEFSCQLTKYALFLVYLDVKVICEKLTTHKH